MLSKDGSVWVLRSIQSSIRVVEKAVSYFCFRSSNARLLYNKEREFLSVGWTYRSVPVCRGTNQQPRCLPQFSLIYYRTVTQSNKEKEICTQQSSESCLNVLKSLNKLTNFPFLNIFCSFTHRERCSLPKTISSVLHCSTLDPSVKFHSNMFLTY